MSTFELTTWLPAPPSVCFELSLSVDAHTGSMSRHGERAVAGVTSGVLTLGDEVTWQARHGGIPFRLTSRITELDAPHRFVDEQVAGPFRSWWHEHRFDPDGDGTLMTDNVVMRAPCGPVGRAVERLVLTDYMTRLLESRNAWLAESLA